MAMVFARIGGADDDPVIPHEASQTLGGRAADLYSTPKRKQACLAECAHMLTQRSACCCQIRLPRQGG